MQGNTALSSAKQQTDAEEAKALVTKALQYEQPPTFAGMSAWHPAINPAGRADQFPADESAALQCAWHSMNSYNAILPASQTAPGLPLAARQVARDHVLLQLVVPSAAQLEIMAQIDADHWTCVHFAKLLPFLNP
jgi:hypothetical protein